MLRQSCSTAVVTSTTAVLQPLLTVHAREVLHSNERAERKGTQVSEAVVAETAETSNQREERRNNRGERRGRGERRNNRAREEEKDKYIERVVTINAFPRSSRVVVASASPHWSSLVTVTAWSALATVRLRKFPQQSPRVSRKQRRTSSAFPASKAAPSRTACRVRQLQAL